LVNTRIDVHEAAATARIPEERQTRFDEPVAALPAWIDYRAATAYTAVTTAVSHSSNCSLERQARGDENERGRI